MGNDLVNYIAQHCGRYPRKTPPRFARLPRAKVYELAVAQYQSILSAPTVQTTDINPYHIQDFTERSLIGAIEAAGFSIQRVMTRQTLRPLAWGNPFAKDGRILPNVMPKTMLLRSMVETYLKDPSKFLCRLYLLIRHGGFPGGSTTIVAIKK